MNDLIKVDTKDILEPQDFPMKPPAKLKDREKTLWRLLSRAWQPRLVLADAKAFEKHVNLEYQYEQARSEGDVDLMMKLKKLLDTGYAAFGGTPLDRAKLDRAQNTGKESIEKTVNIKDGEVDSEQIKIKNVVDILD